MGSNTYSMFESMSELDLYFQLGSIRYCSVSRLPQFYCNIAVFEPVEEEFTDTRQSSIVSISAIHAAGS